MFVAEPIHAFQFHQKRSLDHYVGQIVANRGALINNRKRRLRFDRYPQNRKFTKQSPLINLLKKPRPKRIRNLKNSPITRSDKASSAVLSMNVYRQNEVFLIGFLNPGFFLSAKIGVHRRLIGLFLQLTFISHKRFHQ